MSPSASRDKHLGPFTGKEEPKLIKLGLRRVTDKSLVYYLCSQRLTAAAVAVAAPIYQVLPESFGLHILEGVPCFLVYYLRLQEWLSCSILQPLNFTERKPRLRKVEINLPMTTQNTGEPRLLALGASVCGWPVMTWAQLPPARVECW